MKDFSKALIRVLAIYYFIEFITEGIPQIFGLIYSRTALPALPAAGIGISIFIKLIAAVVLWYSADYLSRIIKK